MIGFEVPSNQGFKGNRLKDRGKKSKGLMGKAKYLFKNNKNMNGLAHIWFFQNPDIGGTKPVGIIDNQFCNFIF